MSHNGYLFDERLDRAFLDSMFEGDKEHAEMVFAQFLELAAIECERLLGLLRDEGCPYGGDWYFMTVALELCRKLSQGDP